MDASHILLGQPWKFDVNMVYNGRENSFMFEWEGQKIVMETANEIYAILVKSLGVQREEDGSKLAIAIPEIVQPLISEFSELVSEDLPSSLPSMRDI